MRIDSEVPGVPSKRTKLTRGAFCLFFNNAPERQGNNVLLREYQQQDGSFRAFQRPTLWLYSLIEKEK